MILIIFFIGMMVFSLYMMYRNNLVYKARTRIGEKIHKYNYELLEKGTYKTDNIDYSNADRIYSYHTMMWKFWIPVSILEQEIIIDLGLL